MTTATEQGGNSLPGTQGKLWQRMRFWVWSILSVVAVWIIFGWWLPRAVSEQNGVAAGLLGDSFGVVNSLFSGLAFACLIVALHMQRQELALQREELRLTRKELKRSAEAQEASERALAASALANLIGIRSGRGLATGSEVEQLKPLCDVLLTRLKAALPE